MYSVTVLQPFTGEGETSIAPEDVPSYLEKSRRGGHLWLFLAEGVGGQEVRAFGQGLPAAHQIERVELYLLGGSQSTRREERQQARQRRKELVEGARHSLCREHCRV